MVEIIKTGLYDSVQDLGRWGVQEFGVPLSGAMDCYSAKLANAILGNSENAAVMEFTMMGPRLKFHKETLICITGGDFTPKLNGKKVKNNKVLKVQADDELSFGTCVNGCRGYLGIIGGLQSETVMGSRSMYKNVTSKYCLKKGDTLPFKTFEISGKLNQVSVNTPKLHFETEFIEVIEGSEFNKLTENQKGEIHSKLFSIANTSNRMAYQLNEPIPNSLSNCITSLVLPGTVQLTPSGQLIILMRDCQTTGGYPRVLQVTEQGIDRLSQKKIGDNFRLRRKT